MNHDWDFVTEADLEFLRFAAQASLAKEVDVEVEEEE